MSVEFKKIILKNGDKNELNPSILSIAEPVFLTDSGELIIKKGDGTLVKFSAATGQALGNSSVNISTNYNEEDELINITTTKSSSFTGAISVDNLPPEALTRLVKVDNETARLLLTDETVQNGDLVKVESTNRTYIVYDSSRLGTEEAFEEVTGTAISASYDAADQSILL